MCGCIRCALGVWWLCKHRFLGNQRYTPLFESGATIPFAGVEPVLLPRILALIGEEHGQGELYNTLIQTAQDLMS